MGNKSKNQIPKEDRAFLHVRENAKGRLNIKFGPEKYSTNTEKFNQMLMTTLLYGLSFINTLTKDLPITEREKHYDSVQMTLSSVLSGAFPEVFEYKRKQMLMEEEAIERVKKGVPVDEETLNKINEVKESVMSRIKEDEEKLQKSIMNKISKADEELKEIELALKTFNKVTSGKPITEENKKGNEFIREMLDNKISFLNEYITEQSELLKPEKSEVS